MRETGGRTWMEKRCVDRDLVGKPGGKRPFGKRRRKWEYNIKICQIGWAAWIGLM
jgi:hypothetical protein